MAGTRPVVDTFLFSEAHEENVLLAKLHVEADLVHHWVAVENRYTTKGEPKALELTTVLAGARFDAFRDRITVVSLNEAFAVAYRRSPRERVRVGARSLLAKWHEPSRRTLRGHKEYPYLLAEAAQRNAAREAVLAASGGRGWVIVSDVDEMIDAGSPQRRRSIETGLASGARVLRFTKRRFVYDFDNVALGKVRTIPLVPVRSVRADTALLGSVRWRTDGIVPTVTPVAFEYSYCAGRLPLERKLETFGHIGPSQSTVDRALECNHELAVLPAQPHFSVWHETIGAEEAAHPQYVCDNMEALRTRIVNPDYRSARARRYPSLFGYVAAEDGAPRSE